MKTKIIPFDAKMAKDILDGKIDGKIKTKDGKDVRIICTDKASTDDDNRTQIVCLIRLGAREIVSINDPNTGQCWDVEEGKAQHLILEVSEEAPEHQFKPFDKVLVRNEDHEAWSARLYDVWFAELGLHGTQDNKEWRQCIPYEGNEHLVGTTNKPN